jgi:hypothetical protein
LTATTDTTPKATTDTTPAELLVGGPVEAKCGKCKAVTKHTILAMGEEKPSKVRCTLCESDHNFRAPPKARVPKAPRAPRAPKKNPDTIEW